jgi:hypothetical protein
MKMNKTTLTMVLALCSMAGLNAQKIRAKVSDFKLISAVYTVSYPGVQGSPVNRMAEVTVVVKKNGVNFDSFWYLERTGATQWRMKKPTEMVQLQLNDSAMPAKVEVSASDMQWGGAPKKGDTIVLVCQMQIETSDAFTPPNDRIAGSPMAPMPGNYQGELVLRYKTGKKQRYFGVNKLQKGAEIYYP